MRRRTAEVLLLCWLVQAATVRAQPAASQPSEQGDTRRLAKEAFQRAETQYRLGRFAEALAEYQAALKLRHHPSIIFNIAQCYRQMKNAERALFFYKLFLADWQRVYPGGKPPNEAEVYGHIAGLEAEMRDATARARASTPAPTTGNLVLQGVPIGAQVFVDGLLRGVGPILAPLALPPGKRVVRVESPGLEAWSAIVDVLKSKSTTVEVRLRKLVNLGIDSQPTGAVVSVNGEERGWTPLRVTLAAQRPHSLVLRKEGYQPVVQTLTLEPRDTSTASYSLEPMPEFFGTRNEWFAFEGNLALGLGGAGFTGGGGAINIVNLKWQHVNWTNFAIGGGGGAGRGYVHMETRLAYPFRFGRRGQHQVRIGTGFGLFTFFVPDDESYVKQKCLEGCDGPSVRLGFSPAVEYIYQTMGRTFVGGGFRVLVPVTNSFVSTATNLPALGLLSFRLGWAASL